MSQSWQLLLDTIKFIETKIIKTLAGVLIKTLRYNPRTKNNYISKFALMGDF